MEYFTVLPESYSMILQLLLAAFLGMVIGFERERHAKPAGLRTYTLVTLGSALFTIISLYGPGNINAFASGDITRIASQIVVGIGFIGAGIIFSKENSVFGLTTAAGIWASAAVGMAVGFHMYAVAIATTCIMLFVLEVFKHFESHIARSR